MIDNKTFQRLKCFLNKHAFVRHAYIFGSVAKEKDGPLSDIDIAVFLDPRIKKNAIGEKRLFLINGISSAIVTDNFDLVIMNKATPLMNYNIIKEGKVVKSGEKRYVMETDIMSRYLDRKYYDDIYSMKTLERISEKGIL